MLVNKKQLALIIGITERSLSRFLKEGLPIEEKGKKGQAHIYDTAKVVQWLLERERSRTTADKLDLNTERAKLAKAQTEKTEMENQKRRGELVDSLLITNFVAELCRAFVEGIYSAQDRMAPKIDIKTARLMRKEFDKTINNIGDAGKRLAARIKEKTKNEKTS